MFIPFIIALCCILRYATYSYYDWNDLLKVTTTLRLLVSLAVIVVIILMWAIMHLKVTIYKINDSHEYQIKRSEREHSKRIESIQRSYEAKISSLESKNKKLETLIDTKTPFRQVASLIADYKTAIYKKDENYLMYKPRPARKSAEVVRSIKKSFKMVVKELEIVKKKNEFLLNLFPEIKTYFDDEESLVQIAQYQSFDDFNENVDRVRLWLSPEEYSKLSVDERNQLALDKYKKRPKSNWEIGVEYELYIGYLLREGKTPFNEKKYRVVQYGELNGINDLGRDIIAESYDPVNGKTVYIIQCKRWSDRKLIHENAICQLFGTAMEFQIKHKHEKCKFVPVFITTTNLSPMAEEFAKRLNIMVLKIPMGDYPMIKCNINQGEKIYHLPFDQQYHRTIIDKEGEFYAMTVSDAVSKGFRRAMRHFN